MKRTLFPSLLFISLFAAPAAAGAASIFVTLPADPAVGQRVQVDVRADLSDVSLNAIDGTIVIPTGWDVQNIDTSGSVFTLWPVPPKFEPGSRHIEFTAGTPGGVAHKSGALLLTIHLVPRSTGNRDISVSGTGYSNDGQGTRVPLSTSAPVVSTTPREGEGAVAPTEENVIADIGSDLSLFDGRYFLSVLTPGLDPNVTKVEVREGGLSSWTPIEHYYVLHDQSRGSSITIRVSDGSGHTIERHIGPERKVFPWIPALIIGVLLVFAYIIARAWRAYRV